MARPKEPNKPTTEETLTQEAKEFQESKPTLTITPASEYVDFPRDLYNLRSPNINKTGRLYTRQPPASLIPNSIN